MQQSSVRTVFVSSSLAQVSNFKAAKLWLLYNNNYYYRRLGTLAENTSDHGKQTNSSTKERGSRARKLLGANAKNYRLKLKTK